MSKLLGFLLRFLLVLLICNLLAFGAWLLHSRFGWSWWEVGALALGSAALILLALLLRRLYFRHKEERFIRRMVEHDRPHIAAEDEASHLAELRERWRRGLAMLRRSQGLRGDPIYSLPWFMVFGESGSGKSTAISHARLSASASDAGPLAHVTNTRNCDWWFFDKAVVLDTAGRYAVPIHEESDRREWEEFLHLLAAHRRREPLNGLVVTLSVEQLQERSEEQLADYGRCLRQRMQSMVEALGARFPVYLLITKMDRVLGLTALAGLLSREECRQALGMLDDKNQPGASADAQDFLERALAHVGRRLQLLSLVFLAHADSGNAQAAVLPEELYRLAPGIRAFVRGAFGPSVYGESPSLRGLFFSSGRQEGSMRSRLLDTLATFKDSRWNLPDTHNALFLNDFFTSILPRERGLGLMADRLFSALSLRRHAFLVTGLLFLLTLCTYFSVSFMGNMEALRRIRQEIRPALAMPADLNARIGMLSEVAANIRKLEEHHSTYAWMLPGSAQTEHALQTLKRQFVHWMRPGLLTLDSKTLIATLAQLPPERRRIALVYLCDYQSWAFNMLRAVKEGKKPPAIQDGADSYSRDLAGIIPNASAALARIFETYARWETADMRDLEMAQQSLRIDSYLDLLGTDLEWLPEWLDSRPSLRTVRLSDFWPRGPQQPAVAPAYTAEGYRRMAGMLKTLGAAARDKQRFRALEQDFMRRYAEAYRAAWWRLAAAFRNALEHNNSIEQWRRLAPTMAGAKNPYFQYIREMAAAFAAIAELGRPLPEDRLPGAFVATLDGLSAAAEPRTLGVVISERREALESRLSEEKARAQNLQDNNQKLLEAYIKTLEALHEATRTDGDALALVAAGYEGGKEESAAPVSKGLQAFAALKAAMDADFTSHKLFWQLVEGPLAWQTVLAVQRSACELNEIWDSMVLGQTATLSPEALWEQLFGEQSTLKNFVQGPAKPFLRAGGNGWRAARWLNIPYPVNGDLLRFLDQGIDPDRKAQEKYTVNVSARPVNVNQGAEKPHRVRLLLECGTESQHLDNYNYEISGDFVWEPARCGKVSLELDFDSQSLSYVWDGEWAFQRFLRDFGGGEVLFVPDHFPGKEAVLKELGVEEIRVRYAFKGAEEALKAQRYTSVGLPREAAICRGRANLMGEDSDITGAHLPPSHGARP